MRALGGVVFLLLTCLNKKRRLRLPSHHDRVVTRPSPHLGGDALFLSPNHGLWFGPSTAKPFAGFTSSALFQDSLASFAKTFDSFTDTFDV